jgi:hypothetical protein
VASGQRLSLAPYVAVMGTRGGATAAEDGNVGYPHDDGDMIIGDIPYSGFSYDVKFVEGTGKWKGIKGGLRSERFVPSKPGKGAMPGTYQGCRREKGSFELSK